MRYLTFSRNNRMEWRTESQVIAGYLRPDGNGGFRLASGPDDPRVLVMDPRTGKPVMKSSLQAVIAPPPPPPPPAQINWQSVPTYNLGSGDFYINGGHYRSEGYGKAAFGAGYNSIGRLIIENAVIWSDGPIIGGFRGKAKLKNCLLIVTPPSVYGQSVPRAIIMEEWRDLDMENVTIIGGSQIYLTGLNGQFNGDVNAGQGLRMVGVKWHNIMGQRFGVRSNWGATHQYNTIRQNIGGEIGWDVANLVQINSAPRINLRIQWCEKLDELGKGRTEDTISLYGGSGGTLARPGLIADNLLEAPGGFDWNYQAGVSTAYNAGNQITTNVTSPQDVNQTRCSSTSLLIGDAYRDAYDDNTAYVVAARNVAIGARPFISTQAGRNIRFEGNELYECDRHWSGVPYTGYHEGYYQLNSSTRTASDGRRIFGGLEFFNNMLSEEGVTAEVAWNISGGPMENGGSQGGNIRKPPVRDGGALAIANYRLRRQNAGVTCGSSVAIPPEVQQWASKA